MGPKVAIYAGGIIPIKLKKKMVKNESHHPRKKSPGPRVPDISMSSVHVIPSENVETVRFALIQTEKLSYGFYRLE